MRRYYATNIGTIPALPANVECTGTTLSFTYTVSDNCTTANCPATFTVPQAVPIAVSCPATVTLPACSTLADIQTAYTAWVAGFSFSGGCSATTATNIGTIPTLPANVECTGTTLSFTYTVSDNCTTASCPATFTVPQAVPIAVSCPATVTLPACSTLAQIQTAYTAWVAGFSFSGGCSATTATNIGTIPTLPANVECTGTTLSFTYTVSDNCTTASCPATFTVPQAVPIAVSCPATVTLPACSTLADIQTAYTAWVAGFSFSGGCSATTATNIGTIPTLPANVECTGTTLSFTYTVSDNCTTASCPATFTVPQAVPIAVSCPATVTLPACSTLADIQTAYTAWVAGFSFSGGCSATTATNIGTIPTLPANVECTGTTLSFTYTVSDNCTTASCPATFTVPQAVPIAVSCPATVTLPACSTLADIQTAYTAWVAGFSFSGGCSATTATNIGTIPTLPANVECTGTTLSFTYTVSDNCTTASCPATFTVPQAVPIAVSCAATVTLPACSTLADIQTAYTAWVAGFSFSGGCSATTATNIGTIPLCQLTSSAPEQLSHSLILFPITALRLTAPLLSLSRKLSRSLSLAQPLLLYRLALR